MVGRYCQSNRLNYSRGENSFAIQNTDGEWEIIQAQNVELIGTQQYRLSMLLRGQLGTESAMTPSLQAGAPIVYLANGIAQVDMSLNDINKNYYWRYGPVGEAIGSDRFTTEQFAFNGRGLIPFAPVHARWKVRDGDHIISWIRCSRSPDAESWDLYSVPLLEDSEAYEVDILSAGEVVRTFETTLPQITYTSDQRASDLGSATASYDVEICQMSSIVGRGVALNARWSLN